MTEKTQKAVKIILAVLIILTLSFIFSNSIKSKEESGAQSNAVKDILAEILPEDSPISLFLINNTRKVAHFVEFGVLSAELTLYALLFFNKKILCTLRALLLCFFTAFLDETVQVFSERGPSIPDVWIDMFGAFTFAAGIALIYFLVNYFIRKGRKGENNG